MAYHPVGAQVPEPRYEVEALSSDATFFNPGTDQAARVVQERAAVYEVMGRVCHGQPVIESEITSNPGVTYFSVSCPASAG